MSSKVRMFLQFCWWKKKNLLMVFWRSSETSSSFLFVSDHGFTGLGCIPQGLFSVLVFLFSALDVLPDWFSDDISLWSTLLSSSVLSDFLVVSSVFQHLILNYRFDCSAGDLVWCSIFLVFWIKWMCYFSFYLDTNEMLHYFPRLTILSWCINDYNFFFNIVITFSVDKMHPLSMRVSSSVIALTGFFFWWM